MDIQDLKALNPFTRGYIEAALWIYDDDAPSGNYKKSGRLEIMTPKLSDEAVERMINDCHEFLNRHNELLWQAGEERDCIDTYLEWAGIDFLLTRNHEGAGFWDGDWPSYGDALTEASHEFKEQELYEGDNGRLYIT